MSDTTVDNIKIVIKGEDKASSALEKQVQSLQNLSSIIQEINSKFKGASTKGIDKFSESMRKVGESASGITKLANAIGRTKIENFSNFAEGIKLITHELEGLEKVDATKLQSLADIARGLQAAGRSKAPKAPEVTPPKELEPKQGPGGEADQVGDSAERASKGVSAFTQSLINASDRAKRFFSIIAGAGKRFAPFWSGALKAASGASLMGRAFGGAAGRLRALGSDILRIAKYRIIRSVIREITQGFSEGIKNAYQFAKATNNAFAGTMDNLASSAQYLKNSLGAMAMPLLNLVAPAIEFVIEKFVDLLNIINQVFAMLKGQETWTKALYYPKAFGDSMENAARQAKNAAKEIQATILGIDEINPLNGANAGAGGGGGGGGAAGQSYEDMFETVPLGEDLFKGIKETLETLFDPLKKAWEEKGQGVIDAAKYAFESLKGLASSVWEDIVDVWTNGSGQSIVENILQIWTNVLNTIGNVASGIQSAWDEAGRGEKIIQGIANIWETITGHVSNVTGMIADWAKDLNWAPLLDSIGELEEKFNTFAQTLSGVFEDVWKDVLLPFGQWAIEEGLPATIDALASSFEALGAIIQTAWPYIKPLLENLEFFAEVSFTTTVQAIDSLAQSITSLMNGDFKGFLGSLGEVINIFTGGLFDGHEFVNPFEGPFTVTVDAETTPEFNRVFRPSPTGEYLVNLANEIVSANVKAGIVDQAEFEKYFTWDDVQQAYVPNTQTKDVWAHFKADVDETVKKIVEWWNNLFNKNDNSTTVTAIADGVTTAGFDKIYGLSGKNYAPKVVDKSSKASVKGASDSKFGTLFEWIKGDKKYEPKIKGKSAKATAKGAQEKSFTSMYDKYKNVYNKTITVTAKAYFDSKVDKLLNANLNGNISMNVTARAGGGTVNSGEIFVAREQGPELVGTFGSQTAVANNDQIVAGIASGVAAGQAGQIRLLSEQNELLRQLVAKQGSGGVVSTSDMLRALSGTNSRMGHPIVSMG